jgi:uncharacterized protein YndB with AHSA1/START domain
MTTASSQSLLQPFVVSRIFDAPRDLVWKAWTEAGRTGWLGPKGITIHHAMLDLRPGGAFHYAMRTPDGHDMWGKWVIREIAEPNRLVFVNSFSDEAGGITRHPMNAHWPLEMLSTITFEEQQGKTRLKIEWLPLNATESECGAFDEGRESMNNGWGSSLDRLSEYLAGTGSR